MAVDRHLFEEIRSYAGPLEGRKDEPDRHQAICDGIAQGRMEIKDRSYPSAEVRVEGRKDDQGKDGFEFLPADALAAINKVLVFGANKYGARNWEKGMAWRRPANAALRHLFAWLRGEKADAETGFSHLWHLGCCVLFLIAYELRGVGEDDRV